MFSVLKKLWPFGRPAPRPRTIVHLCHTHERCRHVFTTFARGARSSSKPFVEDRQRLMIKVGGDTHLFRTDDPKAGWWAGMEIDEVRVRDPRITYVPDYILARMGRARARY